MPIIERDFEHDPLEQGDLLRGVKLFLTGKMDALCGGESVFSKTDHCVVLSRSCVTAHKGALIVAAVQKMPSQTPVEIKTFDRALHFLTDLRDGNDSPDVFYLGQLPGKEAEGRYAARLDSIHTIEVPQRPEVRLKFIAKHRFARLQGDFKRDLHTRLFQAFASLGFEDISWFSDADLHYLVEVGRTELAVLNSEKERIAASSQADGGSGNEAKAIDNKVEAIERKMIPYQTELYQRQQARSIYNLV